MSWVLIILLGASAALSVDFDNKDACEAAQRAITQHANIQTLAVCASRSGGYISPARRPS